MSGRKRIYVDEGEWNRLRAEAGRLSELRREVPVLLDRVREQTQRDLDRAHQEFERRQQTVEQSLHQLSERNRRHEQETTARLRENARRARQELEDTARAIRRDTTEQLERQRVETQRALAEERRERERHLAELRRELDDVRQDHARAAELEATYLADARSLVAAVEAFPHERYAPGRLEALLRRLETAEATRRQGVTAYGLGNAQALYHDVSDLRRQVQEQDTVWTTARGEAERALHVVEELIRQNGVVRNDSRLRGETPDVDYWSRGALSRLRTEVAALLDRVRGDDSPMTVEQFEAVVDRTAKEFEGRLDTIVRQAGTAIYASQLRTNFAELVARALETNHQYEIADSCFAGEDEREAFYAKGKHLDGSEVVIEIEPTGDDRVECAVRLHSYDEGTPSREERRARVDSINQSLRDNGIAVGGAEEDGVLDPGTRDLDRIRHTDAARRTRATG